MKHMGLRDNVVLAGMVVAAFAFLVFISYNGKVYAPTSSANDSVLISVNVSAKTMVDINPAELSWSGVEPGGEYGASYEQNNYQNIWIENIGSVNITHIWFNNSIPTQRPFATSAPYLYDPANFVVVANTSAGAPDSPYLYINRVEYEEDDPLYVKVPNTTLDSKGVIFGRFRNGSEEYFFEYITGDATGATCSGGTLYINTSSPKTKESTGDVDLTNNPTVTLTAVTISDAGLQNGKQYDVGLLDFGNGEKYCVFVPENCQATGEKVYFVRWNADFLADAGVQAAGCTGFNSGYINSAPVLPGGFYKTWIHIRVPYGTVEGVLKQGSVTVFASSA